MKTLYLSGFEHRLWLGNLSRSLQRHFLAGASIKHPAEKNIKADLSELKGIQTEIFGGLPKWNEDLQVQHPPEEIVVTAGHDRRVGPIPAALRKTIGNPRNQSKDRHLELVEDAVVLIEAAQLGAQVLVDGERLDRLRLHVQVPHFHRKIIPSDKIFSTKAKNAPLMCKLINKYMFP